MDAPYNFLGLPPEDTGGEDARYVVIPVPYDLTTSYITGTRGGPKAIIEASTHMELYDEELKAEPWTPGVVTLDPVPPTALGPEEMVARVRQAVTPVVERGRLPVVLGGEHSITLGSVQALLERHPDLTVLQLDAHADMRSEYMESPYNHACVARRISELCPVSQAGIRSLSPEEAEFLAGNSPVRTCYAREFFEPGADRGALVERITEGLGDTVYITVDLDVFDPSVMPATGTPEPGGLLWYDVLAVLSGAIAGRKVVGFDVMELAPIPGNVAPDFLTARLVYKMMGYINSNFRD